MRNFVEKNSNVRTLKNILLPSDYKNQINELYKTKLKRGILFGGCCHDYNLTPDFSRQNSALPYDIFLSFRQVNYCG